MTKDELNGEVFSGVCAKADAAARAQSDLAQADTQVKNALLHAIADALDADASTIAAANGQDMQAAAARGMDAGKLDRLRFDEPRIAASAEGVRHVASLPDPVGEIERGYTLENGLRLNQVHVPIGVIGMIYEARPNVTVDVASLCLKSGNAAILRGGHDAERTNAATMAVIHDALAANGFDPALIDTVDEYGREGATAMMEARGHIDVLIPRGGAGLIRAVASQASVPVIRTGEGVCHIYIDDEADLDMGAKILFNAKCSRPSVCNAVECVLVHRDVAADFWKKALPLLDEKGVELRADPEALEILGTRAVPAEDSDWDAEYDDYILAVKTAGGMDEAIDFINAHGTQHSEAIITKNYFKAQHFLDHVDAAAVYVNASTRFTDGGEFGLGAEIGISTQKMHARGPMGLEELTSCKYVIYGEGQVR